MVNWGTVTPIVVAIIGISGVVLPIFSTVYVNQFYNKPSINIDIGMRPEKGKQIINITNSGTVPATNLSLVITANNHIINDVTNLLSTTNVFLMNPRPSSLLEINHLKPVKSLVLGLHIEKFANGDGSIIKLAIGATNTTPNDYVVYATHDQGSTLMPPLPFFNTKNVSTAGAFFFIVAEFIVVIYIPLAVKRRNRKRVVQQITKEMIEVRKSLRHNPLDPNTFESQDTFKSRWRWLPRPMPRPITDSGVDTIWKVRYSRTGDSHKIIKETNDYIRVDDFYSKLVERDSYIKNNNQVIDDFTLAELNMQCLQLAEDALTKIDWSKYR
jgi:hypothetical protein